MKKTLIACASVLLLSGTAMAADSWSESFATVDADGSGSISQLEFDQGAGKLEETKFAPTFRAMDTNNSNSVSKSEWDSAKELKDEYGTRFRECDKSWC